MATVHIPILVEPIVEALVEPFLRLPPHTETHWLVDCTLGGGGHCSAFLEKFKANPLLRHHKILALDQDISAVERGRQRFAADIVEGRLEIIHCRFGESQSLVASRPVLGLMADLGFSSDQLEDAERGLSFMREGRLDMRLDSSQGKSCHEILQSVSESELEEWLRELGEEKFSKRIASALVSERNKGRLPKTTKELSDLIVRAIPFGARHGRIHAATRTFQALRIVVNHELEQLDKLLSDVIPEIRKGGRAALLSFHSLEDRRVKIKFKDKEKFLSLSKKAIQPAYEETRSNPRARSAKLRIVELK